MEIIFVILNIFELAPFVSFKSLKNYVKKKNPVKSHLGQADLLEVIDTPVGFCCNQACFLSMCLF